MVTEYFDDIFEKLHIQPVGNGYIDLICPMGSVNDFIDEMNRLKIRIIGFTWWCHVEEGHVPCGMGGPKSKYDNSWFSEIQDELYEFKSNEEIRNFLINIYPKSSEYKDCFVPAFWLDM